MSFQPTFDRVVIERDLPEKVSKGGIVIPQAAQQKADRGTVVAVGPGRWSPDGTRFPISLKVGDRVMFQPYDGTEFKTDEATPRNMIVVSEGSILGVLT